MVRVRVRVGVRVCPSAHVLGPTPRFRLTARRVPRVRGRVRDRGRG